MKLHEIVEMVDHLIPNQLPASTKVGWINLIQNEYYRDYPMPEKTAVFDVTAGEQFYILPNDCPEDRIAELTIGNASYPYVPRGIDIESVPSRFFTVVTGQLMIYPAPVKDDVGVMYYKASPMQLTADAMHVVPSFPADFHELLVFGCAARVAKGMNNTNLAMVFDQDFSRLAEKADIVLRKYKPKTVTVARNWM